MQTKFVKGRDGVLIPEEYLHETAVHTAEIDLMAVLLDELAEYNRELKQIDERLELIWAPESVTNPALVPGRFHVLRRNPPPAPPGLYPLQHQDGSFREPGSWMYDWLRRNDMWNDRAQAERERIVRDLERAKQKRREQEREEIAWEIDQRLRAKESPSVLFSTAAPWKAA